jgi:RNA polymerase sigma-70 factor (ECF subfamily)
VEELNDSKNFEKIRAGDVVAFRAVFDKYYTPMCHYALKFIHDTYLADDIVQEVFIRIWEAKEKIRIVKSLKSYLYISVRNKCLDKLKSEHIRSLHAKSFFEERDKVIDSIDVEYEEFRYHLSACVEKLPPRCKDIYTYSRFQNIRQEKIALEMGISLKTVKSQIGKALRLIRDCLSIFYPEL